jgi:hypothetical protein
MRNIILTGLAAALALTHISAVHGSDNPAANTAQLEELRFSVLGTRLATQFYWQIDSSGKGEVSTVGGADYEPALRYIADPQYRIAPGVHKFDIGEDGYRELSKFLQPIIHEKRAPGTKLENVLKCATEMDIGSTQISWTDNGGGSLMLTNQRECLTPFGQRFKDPMMQSWHVLADKMYAKGHSAVTVKAQPNLPVPKMLSYSEQGIWTQSQRRWEINDKGKGWIQEVSQGGAPGTTSHNSGKIHFQLDQRFYQAILRELDPYLSGTIKDGSCMSEIDISDQPRVKLSWVDSKGISLGFNSDLGCPSFKVRVGKIDQALGALRETGRLGASRTLLGKQSRQPK